MCVVGEESFFVAEENNFDREGKNSTRACEVTDMHEEARMNGNTKFGYTRKA